MCKIEIQQQLKEKVDVLEQSLLAIDTLNNIYQQSLSSGQNSLSLESCAFLLNHLAEPALFQVEALRVMIDGLHDGETDQLNKMQHDNATRQ